MPYVAWLDFFKLVMPVVFFRPAFYTINVLIGIIHQLSDSSRW